MINLQLPTACAVEGEYEYQTGAVAFGDVIHSHAEMIVKRRQVNREYVLCTSLQNYVQETVGLQSYISCI